MKVRIGIDVGGTFTDAVLMDNSTYEILSQVKVPTTHEAPEGVTKGIIEALHILLERSGVSASQVCFIAHGTTQATNALLEGDVSTVGIVSLGQGLEGIKTKVDTTISPIPLTARKKINSQTVFIDTKDSNGKELEDRIESAISHLINTGFQTVVAAEAFSVDNPENEKRIIKACVEKNIPATATSDISKLYGLKVRTRTAVVNASIMPKMLETADSTEGSIKSADINSPLMVMRCDGGVMSVKEMRQRPILTILSGPAAGVAGALMYEKLTDGLFFEVGGTSTDISCIKDGKVMLRYAEVGGHKTYLNSLDVRTVGIGGGSMIAGSGGKIENVGPRSAHIAGLEYEVYTKVERLIGAKLKSKQPKDGDTEYYYLETPEGENIALTLAGAANVAGYVPDKDYAAGYLDSAQLAWGLLGESAGLSAREAAIKALVLSSQKNNLVVEALMKDYGMDKRTTVYVGGGGGASVVVPHLAEVNGMNYRISKNSEIISTIGVALAMVRDMVERTIPNPSNDDIIDIRREAKTKALKNGAKEESIEVEIEVDSQRNIVRAIATGVTELRSKNMQDRIKSEEELKSIVAENLALNTGDLSIVGNTSGFLLFQAKLKKKMFFGLFKSVSSPVRLIDREGVIRLQRQDALVENCTVSNWQASIEKLLDELTIYNDGGANYPNINIVIGSKLIDLSGLASPDQILKLAEVEISAFKQFEPMIIIASRRV